MTDVLQNSTIVPGNFRPTEGFGPNDIAFGAGATLAFVTDGNSGEVSVLDAHTGAVVRSEPAGSGPDMVASDSARDLVYVGDGDGQIWMFNGSTGDPEGNFSVGSSASAGVVVPGTGELFVTDAQNGSVAVVDGSARRVVGWIGVGPDPRDIAYDPVSGRVYVSNWGDPSQGRGGGNVSVVDPTTRRVVASVPTGIAPWGIAVDTWNDLVFVPSGWDNLLTVFNGSTDRVVNVTAYGLVQVGVQPYGAAYDPRSGDVFVADSDQGAITVLNGSNASVIATLPEGPYPFAVADDPSTGTILVANVGGDSVAMINTSRLQVTATVRLADIPGGIFSDGSGTRAYVPGVETGVTDVLNASTGAPLGTIPVGGVSALAVPAPGGPRLFLGSEYAGNVTVVWVANGSTMGEVPVGFFSGAMGYDPLRGIAYFGNYGPVVPGTIGPQGFVTAVNVTTDRILGSLAVGAQPRSMAFAPATGRLYVANTGSGNVSVIDTTSFRVVQSFPLSDSGWVNLTWDPGSARLWATEPTEGMIEAIDPATGHVAAQVPVGDHPTAVAVDDPAGRLLVTNGYSDNVTILNSSSGATVCSLEVGVDPLGLTVDPSNGEVLVANGGSGSVAEFGLASAQSACPAITAFSAAPVRPIQGQPVTFRVVDSGGVPPLEFSYSGLPGGCNATVLPQVNCTPLSSGRYTVNVQVNDSFGREANTSLTVEIAPSWCGRSVCPMNASAPGLFPSPVADLLLISLVVILVASVIYLRVRRRERPGSSTEVFPPPVG